MPGTDHIAVERAESWVSDLDHKLLSAQSTLSTLNGFCDGEALAEAVCGAIGSALEEAHQQMRTLRQAIRDMEED